jgi:adenylate cyclase
MAEFGAPLADEKHALNACIAAIEMQAKLQELRDKLKNEGRPELFSRIGINSGTMVIGNMGSSMIFDYTVMGDNVNLSSRLEGANKEYGTNIMCSEFTKNIVGDEIITRELDLIRVKGKTEGVRVYEILAKKSDSISETKKKVIEKYMEGLSAYKERRWEDGIRLFSEAIETDGTEQPSRVYLERCRQFKDNPPPVDWDGIFTLKSK